MRPWLALLCAAALLACGEKPAPFEWNLPSGFPTPTVPADNPMSREKVELGRHLFYDRRLSGNETTSCGTCHLQALAFTEGRAHALGSTGELHRRSSMSLVNVAYLPSLTWANPLITRLEQQALLPMFGEEPVELGLAGKEQELLQRLRADATYQKLFPAAFPEDKEPFSLTSITRALASFQRSLISGRSAYDRYASGEDPGALSSSAKRGMALFFSEKTECFHCHGGFNFSDSTVHEGKPFAEVLFHNTGLYNLDGQGAYPAVDTGLLEVTQQPEDMGRFRTPTLRNIALTAPYMHDGSIATLEEAIAHYQVGGRRITEGPHAGSGELSPLKSSFVKGFTLSEQERDDLASFLRSLTDEEFVRDPRFADPFAVK